MHQPLRTSTAHRRGSPVAGIFEKGAFLGSVALVGVGLWWLHRPSAYPFGPDDRYHDLSLVVGVSARHAALVAVATGAVSATVALVTTMRAGSFVHTRIAPLVAAPMAVLYGYVVPDIQILILVAYALTLSLPAIAAFLVVSRRQVRRHGRPGGRDAARTALVTAAATLVVTLAVLFGLGRPTEWGNADEGHAAAYRPLILLGSLLLGIAWAGVAVRAFRASRGVCVRCGQPGPAWTSPGAATRWGRAVTWAAALTPLPYVVARLTWLTPWPYGESAETLANTPALWVFGLALAAAGEVGTWLTLGLIRRRGEQFPRWVPVWGNTPVPVMWGVVPSLSIALLMCVGGHSIVQQAFGPGTTWEDHSLVLFVPLPLWGPLLAVAGIAYWYRRRPPCSAQPPTSASSPRHDRREATYG